MRIGYFLFIGPKKARVGVRTIHRLTCRTSQKQNCTLNKKKTWVWFDGIYNETIKQLKGNHCLMDAFDFDTTSNNGNKEPQTLWYQTNFFVFY